METQFKKITFATKHKMNPETTNTLPLLDRKNFQKRAFILNVIIVLGVIATCIFLANILHEIGMISDITKNIVETFFSILLWIIFYKKLNQYSWSKNIRYTALLPFVLAIIDNTIDIIEDVPQFDFVPLIGQSSLFNKISDDFFTMAISMSIIILFIHIIAELASIQFTLADKSESLKQKIGRRQRMEERRRLEQQYEIVGQLAGGVAHEFNNILTIIIGNLSLASSQVNDSHRPYIEKSLASAERASSLVKKLLSFSHRDQLQLNQVHLDSLLEQFNKIANRDVDPSVQIHIKIEPNLPPIFADESRLFFVLMHLTRNASEAIDVKRKLKLYRKDEQASISFEIKSKTIGRKDVHHISSQKCGDYIVLTIRDNGIKTWAQESGLISLR